MTSSHPVTAAANPLVATPADGIDSDIADLKANLSAAARLKNLSLQRVVTCLGVGLAFPAIAGVATLFIGLLDAEFYATLLLIAAALGVLFWWMENDSVLNGPIPSGELAALVQNVSASTHEALSRDAVTTDGVVTYEGVFRVLDHLRTVATAARHSAVLGGSADS